ncbi:MAG TPA: hypothetical protein VFW23_06735 [Tepidisphaeraceae bacterium]|nr:hypothetical protein [Tepidisphaeraceae bacterium]
MSTSSKLKKLHDIHRPLPPDTLELARAVAERYQLRLWREEGHWFGAGIEEPGTFGDGRTLPQCVRNVREALAVTVAWHIEDREAVVEPIVDQQRRGGRRKVG